MPTRTNQNSIFYVRLPRGGRLRISRTVSLSSRGKRNGSYTPKRKATRGSLLWTPRRNGEPKGESGVAAKASTRGCCARIPLPLSSASDRGCTPHILAARRIKALGRRGRRPPTVKNERLIVGAAISRPRTWYSVGYGGRGKPLPYGE